MTPSTVMGFSYIKELKEPDGRPSYEGDIGDFINYARASKPQKIEKLRPHIGAPIATPFQCPTEYTSL